MSAIILLGWVIIILGIILVVIGFTVRPAALRPGWGALILGVVLVVIGYLVPYVIDAVGHSDAPAAAAEAVI